MKKPVPTQRDLQADLVQHLLSDDRPRHMHVLARLLATEAWPLIAEWITDELQRINGEPDKKADLSAAAFQFAVNIIAFTMYESGGGHLMDDAAFRHKTASLFTATLKSGLAVLVEAGL